jgi:hypothetical protein
MRRFRRQLISLLVPLAIVAVLGAAATLFFDQQIARTRLAEAQLQPVAARAEAAEARAARAEASLTAIAVQRVTEASATSTAVARQSDPQRALERSLGRLFASFQDPTGRAYEQLAEVFSPTALPIVRAEADYLRGSGRHLGGASTFNVDTGPVNRVDQDRAEVRTQERWVYDERDASDNRQRCFVEDSDQNYVLKRQNQDWIVDEIQLLGDSRRSECPPGG